MHRKLCQEYGINATRDQVYDVMMDLDPEGLEARGSVGAKKKRQKGNFTARGSNWVHSPAQFVLLPHWFFPSN